MINRQSRLKKTQERKAKRMKTTLFIILTLLLACGAGVVHIYGLIQPPELDLDSAYVEPHGDDADKLVGDGLTAPEGFTSEDRKELFYTFLIVGKDEGVNTDTIMLASYDGVSREANLISIPRDSKVNVKRTVKKINAAFPAGTLNGGGTEGGIEQLKRELKTIIGFTPDFYVCVDLEAFELVVDSLGGVNIDVPYPMKYDDPYQNLHINIEAGPQELDGKTALHFARYRKGNSKNSTITDYQRIENQQALLSALFEKALTPKIVLKAPELAGIYLDNVETDLKLENLLWFASELNKMRGTDAFSTYTLPTTGTSGEPNYYEFLDEAGIVELVNETINPYTKDIEAKDLDIINY